MTKQKKMTAKDRDGTIIKARSNVLHRKSVTDGKLIVFWVEAIRPDGVLLARHNNEFGKIDLIYADDSVCY